MHTDVVHDTEDHISEEAVRQSATSIVPPDSLLVVIRSGILARKLPVALTGRSVSFNQDIKAIHPNVDRVDPHFLFLALRASEELILTEGVKTGATVHSVMSGFLENLKIPLPPLAEQHRLAARLREQLAAVADARAALQAQLAAVERLPAALLREVFGG
jgi:type I restriction enzyme S subunit